MTIANIAHRGASADAPENTLAAMDLAVEQGADGLELDLHRSADGEVIVLHDPTVDRTTDGTGFARAMPLAELQSLDAGAGRPEWQGKGVRIPTFAEVLERYRSLWLSLDLKEGDPQTEARTVELLRQHGRRDDVALGAEDPAAARRLRRLAPEFPAFFSRSQVAGFALRSLLRCWLGYRVPADSLQIPMRAGALRLDHSRIVADAHRRGVRVMYWTINDEDTMRELIALGADGIITDRPALLRQLLRSPERT